MEQSTINQFNDYVTKESDEAKYQELIENNTKMIPRQWLHNSETFLNTVIKKTKLGTKYINDFMLLSKKENGDLTCIHIEIEKPTDKIFNTKNFFLAQFLRAWQQVLTWKSYLSEPEHRIDFKKKLVPILEKGARISHRYVLVYGRREEIDRSNGNDKYNLWGVLGTSSLKVITYDVLLDNLTSYEKRPLHLATLTDYGLNYKKIVKEAIDKEFLDAIAAYPNFFHFKEEDKLTIINAITALKYDPALKDVNCLMPNKR